MRINGTQKAFESYWRKSVYPDSCGFGFLFLRLTFAVGPVETGHRVQMELL
jgi:hypothetical protein